MRTRCCIPSLSWIIFLGVVAQSASFLAFPPRMSAGGGIDVAKVRADTRGCSSPSLGIHLNNAGASLMPSPVAAVCRDIIDQEELEGGYETAAARLSEMDSFYDATSKLLNCHPDELAFVDSATRGWTLAVHSIPFKPGDRLITTACDYGSNFVSYLQANSLIYAHICP